MCRIEILFTIMCILFCRKHCRPEYIHFQRTMFNFTHVKWTKPSFLPKSAFPKTKNSTLRQVFQEFLVKCMTLCQNLSVKIGIAGIFVDTPLNTVHTSMHQSRSTLRVALHRSLTVIVASFSCSKCKRTLVFRE